VVDVEALIKQLRGAQMMLGSSMSRLARYVKGEDTVLHIHFELDAAREMVREVRLVLLKAHKLADPASFIPMQDTGA
jgi:hypothetical protein